MYAGMNTKFEGLELALAAAEKVIDTLKKEVPNESVTECTIRAIKLDGATEVRASLRALRDACHPRKVP